MGEQDNAESWKEQSLERMIDYVCVKGSLDFLYLNLRTEQSIKLEENKMQMREGTQPLNHPHLLYFIFSFLQVLEFLKWDSSWIFFTFNKFQLRTW